MSRLIENYKAIRDYYKSQPEHVPFSTTMEELANLLFCSQRNTKFILSKLIESGWILFSPGRGRGNKSHLTFLKSIDDAAFSEAINLFMNGKITEGLELATLYGSPDLKKQLLEWLNQYFGYTQQENAKVVKDIIRLPMFRTFNSIVPSKAFFDFDVHLIKQVYDTIVLFDHSTEKVKGKLAHHWEVNEEKTEWTFYLKKGLQFHNDKELISTDIHFTFSLLFHPDFEQSWLVKNINDIECLNRYTVRFHLHKPNELFLRFLSFPALSIIPAEGTDYIGTGPFKVHTYNENYAVLEANSSYYEGRPFVDRFEILNVPREYEKEILADNSSIFVNTGESNYSSDDPSHEVVEGMYEGSSLLTFNLRKKNSPLQSIFFRKALNKLIDRKKLIADLGSPRLLPSFSFEMQRSLLMTQEKIENEEIQFLLQQSSYSGEPIQLFTYERHQPDAEWIMTEAAQYGISIHITILGWQEILNEESIQQADCILFEAVWGEKEMSKLELYQSRFSFLHQHLDPEIKDAIDRKIETILATSKEEERSTLFSEIEAHLISEQAAAFLVHKSIESTFHPSIKGVKINSRGHVDFKNIWIKPDVTKKDEIT
ncbi:ABC transporter substrate-binding protein [Bacillus sp. S/N-304-OC-R1]|uniref:ABC transporter substrate-binding protein n=1 Tax=Bacillus sp. S/N-304-OC-R1 TaxID=2758034 RepID=UPI001C8EFEDF|nr:ABC transporter substrate-binding protein [Bacillus sp. S/N-304-OC-R1]MBY0121767.1 SgrR family transcriptional regulator [Bacillus sp. S/N-304-OC-R1]